MMGNDFFLIFMQDVGGFGYKKNVKAFYLKRLDVLKKCLGVLNETSRRFLGNFSLLIFRVLS